MATYNKLVLPESRCRQHVGEAIFFTFSAFLPKLVSKICLILLVLVEVQVVGVIVSFSNLGQPWVFLLQETVHRVNPEPGVAVIILRVISCVEPRVSPDKVGFLQHRDQLMDELDNFLLVMLLCHSELGQPEFSAPIPLAKVLQDHHQLLWGGCVEMCRQVVKPAAQLLTGSVESIEPLSVSVTHGGSHKDLVCILLLVFYPSKSCNVRRDICLVGLVRFVPTRDYVVLGTNVRIGRICPVAVTRNSKDHGYEGNVRI